MPAMVKEASMSLHPPQNAKPKHRRTASASTTPNVNTSRRDKTVYYVSPSRHWEPVAVSQSSSDSKLGARFMNNFRKTLVGTPKRKAAGKKLLNSGMISTPEERSAASTPHYDHDPAMTRPTIEQIAMGLHTSRTPHLRALNSASSSRHNNSAPGSIHQHRGNGSPYARSSDSSRALPPPPSRSSMKQATRGVSSPASASSTTVGSHTHQHFHGTISPPSRSSSSTTATARASGGGQLSVSMIKFHMSKLFMPKSRNVSAPSSMGGSPGGSTDALSPGPMKKAVRFSTSVEGDGPEV